MKKTLTSPLPEASQLANLMAHPAAGAMALSALGFGVASQAVGHWMGVIAMAADASQRFWAPLMEAGQVDSVAVERSLVQNVATTNMAPAEPRGNVVMLRKPDRGNIADAAPGESVVAAEVGAVSIADDLKAISGIGPKMEQVLNGLGVRTYAQIAAWDDAAVARIEDAVGFKGRIERDGWIAQAAALSGGAKIATGRDA